MVVLARHGRTALNADGRLRGRLDPPLDPVGRAQAIALAGALSAFHPALVVTSPLLRASETADAIGARCGLTPEIEPRLIDRDYGPHAGERPAEIVARFGSVAEAPGVEPAEIVATRARTALEDAARRGRPGPVVVVAHDAINRPLLAALAPSRFSTPDAVPQRTGSFNILYRASNGWIVTSVDVVPDGGTPSPAG